MKNRFFSLLISSLAAGFWAVVALFFLSFLLIHLFRWAIGYCLQKKSALRADHAAEKPQKPTEKREKPPEKPPEKIYYIVERKKKRESSKYSEPKEFRFK